VLPVSADIVLKILTWLATVTYLSAVKARHRFAVTAGAPEWWSFYDNDGVHQLGQNRWRFKAHERAIRRAGLCGGDAARQSLRRLFAGFGSSLERLARHTWFDNDTVTADDSRGSSEGGTLLDGKHQNASARQMVKNSSSDGDRRSISLKTVTSTSCAEYHVSLRGERQA